ncbi:hypothetical protein WS93_22870 [Burkholderia cepacia]|nr:hypothetical protein WS93_22870 [Burkholderia cepacia]
MQVSQGPISHEMHGMRKRIMALHCLVTYELAQVVDLYTADRRDVHTHVARLRDEHVLAMRTFHHVAAVRKIDTPVARDIDVGVLRT